MRRVPGGIRMLVLRGWRQPDRGNLGWHDPGRAASAPAEVAQGAEGSRLIRPVAGSPPVTGFVLSIATGPTSGSGRHWRCGVPEDQDVIYDALSPKNAPGAAGREKPGAPVLRTGPHPRHHPSCWSVVGHARPAAGKSAVRSIELSCSLGPAAPIGLTPSAGIGAWQQATYSGGVTFSTLA